MGLLTPGYWPSTYWAKDYWHDNYWPHYRLVEVQPNAFIPKAAHSAYFPVAVHQMSEPGKLAHDAGIIPKVVKG